MYHTKVAKKISHLKKKVHVIKFCNYAVEKKREEFRKGEKKKGPQSVSEIEPRCKARRQRCSMGRSPLV